jgi:hypothetical protein
MTEHHRRVCVRVLRGCTRDLERALADAGLDLR